MVAAKAAQSGFRSVWKTWYEPAAIPIYVVTGVAVSGSCWYLSHLMRHPDVVWDRHNNPEPWNAVGAKTQSKLYSHTPTAFDGQWSRLSTPAGKPREY